MEPPITYWATSSKGDPYALPLVDFGVAAMVATNGIAVWVVGVALVVGVGVTFYNRVIQYKVKFTWVEKVHFVYFSIQVAAVVLWLWFIGAAIQNGGVNWIFMGIALVGLLSYGYTLWDDLAHKRL